MSQSEDFKKFSYNLQEFAAKRSYHTSYLVLIEFAKQYFGVNFNRYFEFYYEFRISNPF